MPPRPLRLVFSGLLCAAALLTRSKAAHADVATPGTRIVPSEVVFTGLRDFPGQRFVVAVVPFSAASWTPGHGTPPPTPVAVREGQPVSTDTIYFEELRAIPEGAPEPVTDAWLEASKAPTSGSFTRHPRRVPIESGERMARAHYHVRQIRYGFISLELTSAVALMNDGSERPLSKIIPRSYRLEEFTAPPGWQLFLMPDPAWPRAEPSLAPVPCAAGDALPSAPGPRTLVAVLGAPGPDGSLDGKKFFAWLGRLDPWSREEVGLDSAAVRAQQPMWIEIDLASERPLHTTVGMTYEDADGDAFEDEDARRFPIKTPIHKGWWAGSGAAAALLIGAGAWLLRRRRRGGAVGAAPP